VGGGDGGGAGGGGGGGAGGGNTTALGREILSARGSAGALAARYAGGAGAWIVSGRTAGPAACSVWPAGWPKANATAMPPATPAVPHSA
jgi:hypothetical protein